MTIKDLLEKDHNWSRSPSARQEMIIKLSESSGVALPTDYLEFLQLCNGGEGELPIQPLWFQIWPAEEVMKNNQGYSVNEFIPGFFGIGSNGGDELLAFDMRGDNTWPVVAIPFIPMEAEEAILVAPSFLEFVAMFGIEEKNG